MRRRAFIGLGLGAAALLLASGHTPYRQWVVYRKRRLLIGTSRADGPTYPLGRKVAATLATYLPRSKARVSRAPDPWRLASLIATGQLDVGIMALDDAAALREARAPFAEFGGVPVRSLFAFEDYRLICRAEFPERHAFRVSRTLNEHAGLIPGARPVDPAEQAVPIHPGALAYAEGRALPSLPEATEP